MPRVEKTCEVCGKTFTIFDAWAKRGEGLYCSWDCYKNRTPRIQRACQHCGSSFETIPSQVAQGKGKFCSRSCAGKHRSMLTGPESYAWKGGRVLINGYVEVYRPEHPNARASGYVKEHRLVMSEFLDRPLFDDEIVHHINGDITDNRLENLSLTSVKEHASLHAQV